MNRLVAGSAATGVALAGMGWPALRAAAAPSTPELAALPCLGGVRLSHGSRAQTRLPRPGWRVFVFEEDYPCWRERLTFQRAGKIHGRMDGTLPHGAGRPALLKNALAWPRGAVRAGRQLSTSRESSAPRVCDGCGPRGRLRGHAGGALRSPRPAPRPASLGDIGLLGDPGRPEALMAGHHAVWSEIERPASAMVRERRPEPARLALHCGVIGSSTFHWPDGLHPALSHRGPIAGANVTVMILRQRVVGADGPAARPGPRPGWNAQVPGIRHPAGSRS